MDEKTAELIFQGDAKVLNAVLNSDAMQIVARDENEVFHVLQTSTGKEVSKIRILPKPQERVAFSSALTESFCSTGQVHRSSAELWELNTGRRLAELTADVGEIRTLSFGGDVKRCIIGNFFAPARLYDLEICGSADDLLALAKRRVPCQLTGSERQQYLPVTTQ